MNESDRFLAQVGHEYPDAWTERVWFSSLEDSGHARILDVGLGRYPGRGVMDGFVALRDGNRQQNCRWSAHLKPSDDDSVTVLGPLKLEIVAPNTAWKLTLDSNDSPLSFDLTWTANAELLHEPRHTHEIAGSVVQDISRYIQVGSLTGWLDSGRGPQLIGEHEDWAAFRDHSWGVRWRSHRGSESERRAIAQAVNPGPYIWVIGQLGGNQSVSWSIRRGTDGEPRINWALASGLPGETRGQVIAENYQWSEDGETPLLVAGEVRLSNLPEPVRLRGVPQKLHLKGGLYGDHRGWHHGKDMGPAYEEEESWDLSDNETVRMAGAFGDQPLIIEWGNERGPGIAEYSGGYWAL